MANELQGMKVAFLAADGVEQIELTEPWKAVERAGGTPELVSIKECEIQGVNHMDKADTFTVDVLAKDASCDDYAGIVQPGGVANPDFLRADEDAVRFFKSFFDAGKPAGVICHGPWMLVEAGVARGRTVTSWPSVKTDLMNAGATWVDEECVVDQGLVTSRKPDDLPAFCAKIVEEFAEGVHVGQRKAS
jgi:protease I